jgi:asparagine synthase (glutamine-hydrolysing)
LCGIAGGIQFDGGSPASAAVLGEMGERLQCRGPDASGVWRAPGVGFAHRRLTVIDPEGGGQPMHLDDPGGRPLWTLVYNGELYNTPELRSELAARGHRFRGHSDTEVLLHAVAEWGEEAVPRLNGIFAFAAYDHQRRTLLMARDRLGVKPLFYTRTPAGLLFGSEVKALLAHPTVPAVLDRDGLSELFAVGPARTPGTGIFHGIRELLPGELLTIGPGRFTRRRYWALESHAHPDDLSATAARVRDLLADTVSRQLVSDVPLVSLLSGGLDSSAVSALAVRALADQQRPGLHTFSVDFVDQARFFEAGSFQHSLDAPWARQMAEYLGTRHREVVIDTADLIHHVDEALTARDHPGMADIDISLLMFCREIRREAVVALSGEAADELFGGYPWCHREDALRADTFPWARRLPDRLKLLSQEVLEELRPAEYVQRRYREALEEVPRLSGESSAERRIREVLYLNLTRFLPTLLDRKDRMSMAVGLEVRVPFCDHRLVEYVWNIPWSMKSLEGEPKGILREALKGILPEDVRRRQKTPYPTTHHPAYAEMFRREAEALLLDTSSPIRPYLDLAALDRLVHADPRSWELPWFGQMMGVPALFVYLVQADRWFRRYHITVSP